MENPKAVAAAPARNARATLDQEMILTAALGLVAREKLLSLSFRELGRELGVDPTAVYRHFHSKESLMKALLDRVLAMTVERTKTPPDRWSECLMEFAAATMDCFICYPAVAMEATSVTTGGPGELDAMELMLSCFSAAGLRGAELARQYAVYGVYVLSGAVGLARSSGEFEGPKSNAWFSGQLLVDAEQYPNIAATRQEILGLDHSELFLTGVRQIVQAAQGAAGGAAARAGARPGPG